MRDLINKVFKRIGYTDSETVEKMGVEIAQYRHRAIEYEKQLKKEQETNIDKLMKAIKSANMVQVIYEQPGYDEVVVNDSPLEFVKTKTKYPPEPQWYAITTRIDMGMMHRIYDDMHMHRSSPELDYLFDSIAYEIRDNAIALMRLKRGA